MRWAAFDFETSDQNKYACKIDSVSIGEFDYVTGRIRKMTDVVFSGMNPWEELSAAVQGIDVFVAHNADFDLYLMEERCGVRLPRVEDTYLMAKHWRNDLQAYDLKTLAWLLFGDTYQPLLRLRKWIHDRNLKLSGEDDPDLGFDMTVPPRSLVDPYRRHDVKVTARLVSLLHPNVKDSYAYQMDTEFIRTNMEIQKRGIHLDIPLLRRMKKLGRRRIRRNTKQAADLMDVDTDGRKPTGNALRERLADRGESRKTRTGMVKADDVILRDHTDDPAVRSIRRVRRDTKEIGTYIDNLLLVGGPEGFFHPNLVQSAAVTRRWRSWDMYSPHGRVVRGQVQNITRGPGIRSAFVVPDGYGFVKLDLASIEARMGAHAMAVFLNERWFAERYCRDPRFNIYIHVASVCAGLDVDKKTDIYQAYKHACLGNQYGVGMEKFYRILHDKFELSYNKDESAHIYRSVQREFPVFRDLQRAVSSIIETQGCIMDDFGAVYYVPKSEQYKGVNYYCQGCAGNVLKWWGIRLVPLMRKNRDWVFNIVHDEFDAAVRRGRDSRSRIKAYCGVLDGLDIFELPITAEASGMCDNWGEAG